MNKGQLAVEEMSVKYQMVADNSGLRRGYKQTEVGIIPDDWEVDSIVNLAMITTGDKNTQDKIENGTYPFFVRSSTVEHINSFTFDGEAVLTAGDGVGTGKIFHYINGKFDFHQRVYMISNFGVCLDGYYFYLYFSNNFYPRIMQMTAKSSVDSVRREMIANMLIPVPPSEEQRAIAAVLSDVDALLAKLDHLITKKRDFKQATMQQLLTGKTRLPGFSVEWEIKRLGDLLKVRHGKSQKNVIATGGIYPILATGGEIGRTNTYLYDKPSVLIGRKGTIDRPQYQDSPFWTVDTLFYTELSSASHPKFVYFKFLMIDWRSYNEASGVPSLNASTIENIEISIPKYSEQAAIANILNDMDAEITALEVRRNKTRDLKQGMMQELLTGRIRLL